MLSLAYCLRYIFIKEHKLLIALMLLQIYMTRRSTNKLVPPQEDPEKLFRSSRKLVKTTSLDSSSSLQLEFLKHIEDQLNTKEKVTTIAMTNLENEFGYDEHRYDDDVYGDAVVLVNRRYIRLADLTPEEWLDLQHGDHRTVDPEVRRDVIKT